MHQTIFSPVYLNYYCLCGGVVSSDLLFFFFFLSTSTQIIIFLSIDFQWLFRYTNDIWHKCQQKQRKSDLTEHHQICFIQYGNRLFTRDIRFDANSVEGLSIEMTKTNGQMFC